MLFQAKLKLPFRSLVEEYKVGKTRLQTMLEDSEDKVVKENHPHLRTGRKSKVQEAVEEAKDNLRIREIIQHTDQQAQGRNNRSEMVFKSQRERKKRPGHSRSEKTGRYPEVQKVV